MRLAVVTGAARGVGRATAELLAERGMRLLLVGRTLDSLGAVAAQLEGRTSVSCVAADLSSRQGTEQLEQRLRDEPVHVLVNNAGIVHREPLEDLSDGRLDEQLHVNLRAPIALSRAVVPGMKARRAGRIVNVGSISSTLGSPRAAVYAATKWGLVGLTKSLAEELRDTGVSTCVVLPGSIDTEMLRGSGFEPRMTARDVALTIVHHALDAPHAHNGAVVEMFGI